MVLAPLRAVAQVLALGGRRVGMLLGRFLLADELDGIQESLLAIIRESRPLEDLKGVEGLVAASLAQPDLITVGDLEVAGVLDARFDIVEGILCGEGAIVGCCAQLEDHLEHLAGAAQV